MSLNSPQRVRIVPSGQIYRQLFDAQLLLNRSLSHYGTEAHSNQNKLKAISASYPVIHIDKDETHQGLLSKRQKNWMKGSPNDPYTENPVLYRQFSDYTKWKLQESKAVDSHQEVRGLPDKLVATVKLKSNIIERIGETQRQRHDSALEALHQDLSIISNEKEPLIEEISIQVLQKLLSDEQEINDVLSQIENNEQLLLYKLSDLENIWDKIQSHSAKRQQWITDLDNQFRNIETDRMKKIREVFTRYGKEINKISYLAKSDIQRLMDKESQMINQIMLTNRRSYADLYVRLITADIEREKNQRIYWSRRVDEWKSLLCKIAVENFKEFMQSPEVMNPSSIEAIKTEMLQNLNLLNSQRLGLIKSLNDMKPPNSTKSAVYKWRTDITTMTEQLDSLSLVYTAKLHDAYEKVCSKCLDEMEHVKSQLIESGLCSSHRAAQVVDEYMLPLIGEQQRTFEENVASIEKSVEEQNSKMIVEVNALFKYIQGVAHLWDLHEIGLAKQERALQEKLELCRQKHDQSNQEKEAHLDIVMDRMRQDASEIALKDSLVKALTMLEKIRESYEEFHSQQMAIVKTYPNMIKEELILYDKSICQFFHVKRNTIIPTVKQLEEGQSQLDAYMKNELKENNTEEQKQEELSHHDITEVVKEILTTSRGSEFYVLKQADLDNNDLISSQDEDDELFNTDEHEIATPGMQELKKNMDIPKSLINQAKKTIRLNFLEQLEDWQEQAIQRAESIELAKCEELNSELDLRLHLHQPRPRRIELDVHNVRAAELVLHTERVVRHCSGLEQSLAELHSKFKAMSAEHNKLASKFQSDIQGLETIFISATKSSRIVKLQNQVSLELDKYMSIIRTSLRQFRQHLDVTLQMLRESNARFIKSFKIFSDGGNFCPEEIEDYRKKLEKMSTLIDTTEGSIMSELEGMESKRLESATKISMDFEDRFKGHMNDLIFMEQTTRWLTNTQVKIKTEVANSNMQAQQILKLLNQLESKINAFVKPNLDKELITANELNKFMNGVFAIFKKRCEYLEADKSSSRAIKTIKAGYANDGNILVNKPSKLSDDPTVGLIKNILKSQRNKIKLENDADSDGNDIHKEKPKSAMSEVSSKGSDTNIQKLTAKNAVDVPRRLSASKLDKQQRLTGDEEEVTDLSCIPFLEVAHKCLSNAEESLKTISELFYLQKGARPVTRPQAVKETFEECRDLIQQKILSFGKQVDEYHNQCLQEFRDQLKKLEELCSVVPGIVFTDFLQQEIKKLRMAQEEFISKYKSIFHQMTLRKDSNKNELRPTLGHPQFTNDLATLCALEHERYLDFTETVAKYTLERQETALENSKVFLDNLQQIVQHQLQQYDEMIVVDDIKKGRVAFKHQPTTELIRRKQAGEQYDASEEKDIQPKGKATWIGIPSNQFFTGKAPSKLLLTTTIVTQKTTMAHHAVIQARDVAFEEYKKQFERLLQEIETNKEKLLFTEKQWEDSWNLSVEKVKYLYTKAN
ncbi:coiled-coil domain-containing protein 180-like isoform X2 [Physella acuta]|uniref:coiled-coil domain-containing protein 180-like isoform X2 n=1 Tax=Physella acuta TaxID=109671 RepID=UPI0027DE3B29|nr:coiled-coil domain-containing protein 180-like isoform X2 [Physella acuta]